MLIYQFQGNEYRLTPFKIARSQFCEYYAQESTYSNVYESFNLPKKCPIKQGNYTGEFDIDFTAVPPNFDGKYKVVKNFYYQKQFVGSCEAFVEINHYMI